MLRKVSPGGYEYAWGRRGLGWRLLSAPENFPEGIPLLGSQTPAGPLILPLSSGLLSQLPALGYGRCTANPRCMPGPLLLIGSDGCAGPEGP